MHRQMKRLTPKFAMAQIADTIAHIGESEYRRVILQQRDEIQAMNNALARDRWYKHSRFVHPGCRIVILRFPSKEERRERQASQVA